jgi:hypothetical protein
MLAAVKPLKSPKQSDDDYFKVILQMRLAPVLKTGNRSFSHLGKRMGMAVRKRLLRGEVVWGRLSGLSLFSAK